MLKLDGIKVDPKRFSYEIDCKGEYTTSCTLHDKKTGAEYSFSFVKALEQVGKTFIVFKGADYENAKYLNSFSRVSFDELGGNDYHKNYYNLDVSDVMCLNDDLILFKEMYFDDGVDIEDRRTDDGGKEYFSGIYSIKGNNLLEQTKWIADLQVEVASYSEINGELLFVKRFDEINMAFFTVSIKDFSIKSYYDPARDMYYDDKKRLTVADIAEMRNQVEVIRQQLPIAEREYRDKCLGLIN